MNKRISYEHDGGGWNAHLPDGSTLEFPRTGGVFLHRGLRVGRAREQLVGTCDLYAGRDTAAHKRRAAEWARDFWRNEAES